MSEASLCHCHEALLEILPTGGIVDQVHQINILLKGGEECTPPLVSFTRHQVLIGLKPLGQGSLFSLILGVSSEASFTDLRSNTLLTWV